MNLVNTVEETLNGGYAGLYGEVVTEDVYGLRKLSFQPDLIFDIGANVGVFTRFAKDLFPDAVVVAVEPDAVNCAHFRKFTTMHKVFLLERALGSGPIFHARNSNNGAGEIYMSPMLGYPIDLLQKDTEFSRVPVLSISLSSIIHPFWSPKSKTVVKIDCEGAENCLWQDTTSMALLRMMHYLTIEVHNFAQNGTLSPLVARETEKALGTLAATHICRRDGVIFTATHKRIYDTIPQRPASGNTNPG